ncbi:MAG: lamin tail domain-containing protein [Chloroflexota bacterium]
MSIFILMFILHPSSTQSTQAAPNACGGLSAEGETATLHGLFTVDDDANASGGQYIHVPDGPGYNADRANLTNSAAFCVYVPVAGLYQIKGWVYAQDGTHNSFYVLVDGQPTDGYIWHVPQNTVYQEAWVTDDNTTVQVALTAGEHIITFNHREHGTRLDKMELVLIEPFAEGGAIISEFMASNSSTLNDEDGDSSDWIELHNPSSLASDLDGWYLTDDPADLTKWQFPSTLIAADGYMVIFASGKDWSQAGAELHTNFKLSSSGEYLALVRPDGVTVVSEFAPTYPAQYGNVSFGLDANNSLVYFSPATPGVVNGTGVQVYYLAEPTASVERGFYDTPQTVTLTASSGATIRYTTDATDPTPTHGTIYSDPLTIDQTTTLRFMAYQNGGGEGNESTIATHTYIFIDDVLTQPTMFQSVVNEYQSQMTGALTDLPTISIVTPNTIPGHKTNPIEPVQTSVELIYPDNRTGFQVDAGVKKYGGASLNRAKNNMRLFFDSEFGVSDLHWPLFEGWGEGVYTPAQKFDLLDLRSGGSHDQFLGAAAQGGGARQATYIARRYIADSILDMGSLAPHGYHIHVYINGVYWGQYQMSERVDADFIAEYGTGNDDDYEAVKSTNVQNGITWSVLDGDGAMWQDIVDNHANYSDVKERLDVQQYIDYWLTKTFLEFEDEYRAAGPVDASTPGGYVIDSPDTDGAFNPTYFHLWGTPLEEDHTGWPGVHNIQIDLWNSGDSDFHTLFFDRIANAYYTHGDLSGALEASVAQARFEEWRGYIERSVLAEAARWMDDPGLPASRDAYLDERSHFITQRSPIVLQQLKDRGYLPIEPVSFVVDTPTNVRYVRVMKSGDNPGHPVINLGEVEVFDINGVNRALTGTAAQNSYWDIARFTADKCIDGALTPATGPNLNICTTKGDTANDWWEVDLGAVYDIREIRITNRTDCCADRLGNMFVLASDTPFAATGTDIAAARANADYEFQVEHDVFTSAPHRAFMLSNNTQQDNWIDGSIAIFSSSGDEIFYTTDGTDPRLPGGAVSPSATQYTGPINLTESSVIRARPRKDGLWGPITGDTFHVNPQASAETLLLTEIHYNPDGHDPDPVYGSDEFEFLEFQNIGNERIDLTGVTISQGISFTFGLLALAPGEHVVVVENKAAFASRYQDPASTYYQPNLIVAGQWTGALNNGGDLLVMRDRDGVEMMTAVYNDGGEWPGRADGNGSSLEVENISQVPTDPSARNTFLADGDHWQPSSEYHGSPGRTGLGPDNRVVINEVLAASDPPLVDTIELVNTTGAALDISGWFVSDTSNADNGGFRKYKFPSGTTMTPEQYLVIDETDFNDAANPDNLVPFALSSMTGDDVYLMEAEATGNLLRFVDRVEFGATASNESIGLWPDGLDATAQTGNLYPMQQRTFGAANDSADNAVRVGSVVISEIHYNPLEADQDLEFIELTNNGTITETLDNWRLRGEVDIDFVSGITLMPDTTLIIVGFAPTDTAKVDAFRSAYDVADDITLVGPWLDDDIAGVRLNNGGGTLKLQRSDALVTPPDGSSAFYPMLLEDQVRYDDDAPWVIAPDGNGPSLSRIDLSIYGDNPTNWEAGDPPLQVCVELLPITDVQIGRLGFDVVRLSWTPPSDGSSVEIWRSEQPYFAPEEADSTLIATVPDNRNSHDGPDAALGDVAVNHYYVLRSVNGCGDALLSNRVGEFEYALTETGSTDFNWVGLPLIVNDITLGTADNASLVNHIIANTSSDGVGVTPTVAAIDRWNNTSQSFDSYLPDLPFLGGIDLQVGQVYRVSVDLPGNPVQNAVWTLLGDVPDASVFTQQLKATGTTNYNWIMVPLDAQTLSDSALIIDDVQTRSTPSVTVVSFDHWNRASQSFDTYLPDFPFAEIETAAGHVYRISLGDGVVPGTEAVWR